MSAPTANRRCAETARPRRIILASATRGARGVAASTVPVPIGVAAMARRAAVC